VPEDEVPPALKAGFDLIAEGHPLILVRPCGGCEYMSISFNSFQAGTSGPLSL
jgi:hypothetical protein